MKKLIHPVAVCALVATFVAILPNTSPAPQESGNWTFTGSVTANTSLNSGANTNVGGNLVVSGNSTLSNNLVVNGNSTLGNNGNDLVMIHGDINGQSNENVLPNQQALAGAVGGTIVTKANGELYFLTIATAASTYVPKGGNITMTGPLTLSAAAEFTGNAEVNTLPAQTLSSDHSILTRTLGDGRYLEKNGLSNLSLGGTLGVTGATTVTTLSASGTVTATGNITGSGSNNTLPSQELTSGASIVTRDTGDARYVQDSELTAYRTIATSFDKEQSDDRYLSNNESQIIIGSHEAPDANAALIIGNGVDADHPSNSFVVKKNGMLKIGQVEIDPTTNTVKIPQSGDIGMGAYQ